MELFLLYLWLKVDALIRILVLFGFISGAALAITLLMANLTSSWEDSYEQAVKFKTKTWKRWIVAPILFFTAATILPSKADIAILVGGSYALDVAKSPEAAKLMTVIRGKANEILDEQIKSLNKESK